MLQDMDSILNRVERIASHRYAFTSRWDLPAPRETVFEVLRDLWSYPSWWAEFRKATKISATEGAFVLRSALPIALRFTLSHEVEDAGAGLLRARADGDIEGWVQWQVEETGPARSVACFDQRVVLRHQLARRTDFASRPLLSWNHSVAMKSGYGGLCRLIEERGSA